MKAETYLAQNASKCQNQYKSMSLMHGKKSCATDPTRRGASRWDNTCCQETLGQRRAPPLDVDPCPCSSAMRYFSYLYNMLQVFHVTHLISTEIQTWKQLEFIQCHSSTNSAFEKCNGPKWPHSHALQHQLNRF